MSKVVTLHFPGFAGAFGAGVAMPTLCVACGQAANAARTMKVSGETTHLSCTLSFPLCDSCHAVLTDAGAKPDAGYFKASMFVSRELRARYREIRRSVRVKPSSSSAMRFQFANDSFGEAFEALHVDELGLLKKRRYVRRLNAGQPAGSAQPGEVRTPTLVGAPVRDQEAPAVSTVGAAQFPVLDLRPDDEIARAERAGQPLDEADEALAQEMKRLIDESDRFYGSNQAGYDAVCAQMRLIGERLGADGGSERMQLVAYRVQALGGRVRDCEHHWSGICGWQP